MTSGPRSRPSACGLGALLRRIAGGIAGIRRPQFEQFGIARFCSADCEAEKRLERTYGKLIVVKQVLALVNAPSHILPPRAILSKSNRDSDVIVAILCDGVFDADLPEHAECLAAAHHLAG